MNLSIENADRRSSGAAIAQRFIYVLILSFNQFGLMQIHLIISMVHLRSPANESQSCVEHDAVLSVSEEEFRELNLWR